MNSLLECPTLELGGSGSYTPPPVETLNETGGADGDRFWRLVSGPDGLGRRTVEQVLEDD